MWERWIGSWAIAWGWERNLKTAYEFIDVGEKRGIELCAGDLIQFRVNLKEKKIYNGTLARISRKPGYIDLLDAGGKIRRSIPFPVIKREGCASQPLSRSRESYSTAFLHS